MHGLLQSLRYTIRLLLKSPGFTITAVLILGLGIGVNTAIFSLVDAVILKPLPYPNPERLIQIFLTYQGREAAIDYPDYLDIATIQHSFESLSVVSDNGLDLTGKGEAQRLCVDFVSASMFKVSCQSFLFGRPFSADEDVPGGPMLVVLGEDFWRSRFNADPKIIGTNLTLSDRSFEVIGVAPRQLNYWSPCDVYVPINVLQVFGYPLMNRGVRMAACLGRLKDGVGLAQAQADLESIHNNLMVQYPDDEKGYGIRVVALRDYMVADYSSTIWLLGGAVSCLLLVSNANIANLLFSRGLERRREMTMRAALGASRIRLVGQLLLETAFLSLLGGILGLFVALWTTEIIKALSLQDLYRVQLRIREVSLDARALFFVFCATALTSLLSGVLPACRLSKANLAATLNNGGGRTGATEPQRQRLQSILVVGQVALACVLLIGAGLLMRSFRMAQSIPLGFNPHHLLTAELWLKSKQYESGSPRKRAFWDALLERVRRLPDVTDAALNDFPPFYWGDLDWGSATPFTIVGQPDLDPGKKPTLDWHTISPDYFNTLQIALLKGRDFNTQDTVDSQSVAIIDDALAEHYFPSQDPLGRQIKIDDSEITRTCTIVGVVPHVRYNGPDYPQRPFQAYFPYAQYSFDFKVLILRSPGDPTRLIPSLRKIVASIDPDVPVTRINTLDDSIARAFGNRRLAAVLVVLFAGSTLLLSSVGLYGVLAYTVNQRTREIGVRIALGAESRNILGLIINQGFRIIGIGVVVGLVAAFALTRLIESMLYGVSGTDPITLVLAVVVLGLSALLACLLPALRATRINPITALKE